MPCHGAPGVRPFDRLFEPGLSRKPLESLGEGVHRSLPSELQELQPGRSVGVARYSCRRATNGPKRTVVIKSGEVHAAGLVPPPGVMQVAHEGARRRGLVWLWTTGWLAALRLQGYFCYADAVSLRGPVYPKLDWFDEARGQVKSPWADRMKRWQYTRRI